MRGIATTATQTRTKRYLLAKTNMYRTNRCVLSRHLTVTTNNQIIIIVAVYRDPFLHKPEYIRSIHL